jgi:S-layer protein (TIGR01567 family)
MIKGLLFLLVVSFSIIPAHSLEIRGEVITGDNSWNPQNFAGFDYDMDQDIGTDLLTTTLTDGILSGDEPYGIIYETSKKNKEFANARIGMEYGLLQVSSIDPATGNITLDNRGKSISLNRGQNIEIMPDIYIRTADSYWGDFRYYIFKNITKPGTYEIRGSVAGTVNGANNIVEDRFSWTADNFAGFYYDMDDNIKTEELTTTVSDRKLLEPDGVVYETKAMADDFEFDYWGMYNVIGFMGEKYFTGYLDSEGTDDVLFERSDDENAISDEQLLKILRDEETKIILKKGQSFKLDEGYELFFQGLSVDDGQIYLELKKNGKLVDESILAPNRYMASMYDKTYCYRTNVGSSRNIVTIAVHFTRAYQDNERSLAIVDAIWQLSESPIEVKENTQYGKMTVATVTADSIIMNNKGNQIDLIPKTDVELLPNIFLRTANNDTLRYCIYKTETVGKESA